MNRYRCAVAAALVLLLVGTVPAAKPGGSGAEEKAVRAAGEAFLAAVERKDAKAAAECFTPDGDWINPAGQLVRGREAIRRELEQHLAEPGRGKVVTSNLQVRFLAPTVALVDGTSDHVPAEAGPPVEHRHSVLAVKQDGRWLIAAVRAAIAFPPSHYEELKDLEWLVGAWRCAKAGPEPEAMESVWRWADNKNFLHHEYSVRVNNQLAASGIERVAWDPRERKIKSWLFQSNGSVFEGVWSREGGRWHVRRHGTLEDGTRITSVDAIEPVDARTFRFHSTRRTAEGEGVPDREPVELKRR